MPELPEDLDPVVQSTLRELMQDDYPLLLDTFIQDGNKRLATMASSLECQNWDAFRQAAHSFKGSCGNMGAEALQRVCDRAEQAAGRGDVEVASQSYLELCELFQRVQLRLER